jgi:hypothetical protein
MKIVLHSLILGVVLVNFGQGQQKVKISHLHRRPDQERHNFVIRNEWNDSIDSKWALV